MEKAVIIFCALEDEQNTPTLKIKLKMDMTPWLEQHFLNEQIKNVFSNKGKKWIGCSILEVPGILSIKMEPYEFLIEKAETYSWSELKPKISEILKSSLGKDKDCQILEEENSN